MVTKIFHHNDMDGIVAAGFIVKLVRETNPESEIKCISCGYTEHNILKAEDVNEHDIVYIVDYSFSETTKHTLFKILDIADIVWWIDHHATSIKLIQSHLNPLDKYKKFNIEFSLGYSGAALCWAVTTCLINPPYKYIMSDVSKNLRHFSDIVFDTSNEHSSSVRICDSSFITDFSYKEFLENTSGITMQDKLVAALVDDYDRWEFKFSDFSKMFKLGFDVKYKDLKDPMGDTLQELLYPPKDSTLIHDIMESGYHIFNFMISDLSRTLSSIGYTTTYEGLVCLVVNRGSNSWIYDSYEGTYDIGVSYTFDGSMFKYNLTSPSDSDVDVSKIAERFGGGGHFHAAGFSSDKFEFPKVK